MIRCSAALSWMRHGRDGTILDLGRKRRRPNAALRKAARERDRGRCRYPGCESRKVDLHHIQYWSNGGRTSLDNLVSLCKRHHMAVHDRGYLIAAGQAGTFTFYDPEGTAIPQNPPLPEPHGPIGGVHDAEITPETIIPPWSGERLDLDYAIYICLANDKVRADRAAGRGPGTASRPAAPAPASRSTCPTGSAAPSARTRRAAQSLRPDTNPHPGMTRPARQAGGGDRSPLRW